MEEQESVDFIHGEEAMVEYVLNREPLCCKQNYKHTTDFSCLLLRLTPFLSKAGLRVIAGLSAITENRTQIVSSVPHNSPYEKRRVRKGWKDLERWGLVREIPNKRNDYFLNPGVFPCNLHDCTDIEKCPIKEEWAKLK